MKPLLQSWFARYAVLLIPLLIAGSQFLGAQNSGDYFTVSGIVKDSKTKRNIENVNVSIPGTSTGTVTNADGEFTLKIPNSSSANYIELSHLGYANYRLTIDRESTGNRTVFLLVKATPLKEVVVTPVDPQQLVLDAMNKIPVNYSQKTNLLTGFYRETVRKRRTYVTVSEAVIEIYKTKYTDPVDYDRTSIYKGRKLLSQKADTVIVKLEGGPNLSIYLDIVKNNDFLLNRDDLNNYTFNMEDQVLIDNRPHYVVSFAPRVILPVAQYIGKFYIDRQNLTFSRIEFTLSMADLQVATDAILRRKPFNLRFRPEEVSTFVTYKQRDGISYLNYVRSEVRFKCDWKKRLFATNYAVVSEMVVTDIKSQDVTRIPYRDSFKENQVLSDKVSTFSDPNYWEDYNIIEPTESLESAVGKLKKEFK